MRIDKIDGLDRNNLESRDRGWGPVKKGVFPGGRGG